MTLLLVQILLGLILVNDNLLSLVLLQNLAYNLYAVYNGCADCNSLTVYDHQRFKRDFSTYFSVKLLDIDELARGEGGGLREVPVGGDWHVPEAEVREW